MPDEAVDLPDLDAYPMAKTEWTRFHRLLTIGKARLSGTPTEPSHPDGIFAQTDELSFQFLPPVKATVTSATAGSSNVVGQITHACLSAEGLHLWFRGDASPRSRAIRIGDVISVEQRL